MTFQEDNERPLDVCQVHLQREGQTFLIYLIILMSLKLYTMLTKTAEPQISTFTRLAKIFVL